MDLKEGCTDIVKMVVIAENGRAFFESFTFGIMEAYWNDHRPRGRQLVSSIRMWD
jgi:hypothetical protein